MFTRVGGKKALLDVVDKFQILNPAIKTCRAVFDVNKLDVRVRFTNIFLHPLTHTHGYLKNF